MIKKYLFPDRYFDDIYSITTELLTKLGIKGLICDIDNTLVPYEIAVPTPDVSEWICKIKEAGMQVSFVSNNNIERVNEFNRDLQFFASADSIKPSRRKLRAAMAFMGTDKTNTAVIGDQIFTDIFAGKRLGLYTFLVKPIKDKRTLFFKIKRMFEKLILKMYLKM